MTGNRTFQALGASVLVAVQDQNPHSISTRISFRKGDAPRKISFDFASQKLLVETRSGNSRPARAYEKNAFLGRLRDAHDSAKNEESGVPERWYQNVSAKLDAIEWFTAIVQSALR